MLPTANPFIFFNILFAKKDFPERYGPVIVNTAIFLFFTFYKISIPLSVNLNNSLSSVISINKIGYPDITLFINLIKFKYFWLIHRFNYFNKKV